MGEREAVARALGIALRDAGPRPIAELHALREGEAAAREAEPGRVIDMGDRMVPGPGQGIGLDGVPVAVDSAEVLRAGLSEVRDDVSVNLRIARRYDGIDVQGDFGLIREDTHELRAGEVSARDPRAVRGDRSERGACERDVTVSRLVTLDVPSRR
jgi:hypothetical protein